MSKKDFKGHNYYGELQSSKEALTLFEDVGIYPLSTNGIQGDSGVNLLNNIEDFKGIESFIDIEKLKDSSDTVFITIGDVSVDDIKKLMELIMSYHPDEFNFNDELDCLRIWWD